MVLVSFVDAGSLRRSSHTNSRAASHGSSSSSVVLSGSGPDSAMGSVASSAAASQSTSDEAIANWRYEKMSEQVKALVAKLLTDFSRLEKVQDQGKAVNAELGFSQHIKALSTHVIDLATSLMTEFPDGVPPNSKGEQVLAELETTDEVVEHFVDRLSEIVHLRTKGDQKSMEKSKKVILESDNEMNKDLQDLGTKVDFEKSLSRKQSRENRPFVTEPSMTVPSSSVGMAKQGGGANGSTYAISHDSFQLSPHEKNALDLVVAQAEESVVVNLKKESHKKGHK